MTPPNVVVIVADDMGFSDLGCYGGEIPTPNFDRLARGGVRMSNFYTSARCSPSRASLLTGLHPHQTGIGILTNDDRPRGYPGTLDGRCVTMAEVLKESGYATCLAGKWHLTSEMHTPDGSWPTRRGFDRFFGTITGCGSYYTPGTLTRGEQDAREESMDPDFYYTDAITAEASDFIRDCGGDEPFFLYAAYTAPHWPLHAFDEDVQPQVGRFDAGWDVLRERRMRRLMQEGVLPASARLSERDPTQPAWADTGHKTWQTRRMEVYAAQIAVMDRGVGKILSALEERGVLENTLVIALSDNGASPEDLPKGSLEEFRKRSDILPERTRDGREVRVGNSPDILPGPEDTYGSYGRAWANLSNTPFRYYKRWVHEGGIASPLIAHWPDGGLVEGSVAHTAAQLVDVLPTVLEATGAEYPDVRAGAAAPSVEGRSLLPALRGQQVPEAVLFWEHTGNAAIRAGRWKLVREYPGPWELYDLSNDRAETQDLAAERPELVAELEGHWQRWADRVGVIPWEVTLELYAERGGSEEDAAG